MIGYALCGSFCTLSRSVAELQKLAETGVEIQPIMSDAVYSTDTRFGTADEWIERVESICRRPVIHTIVEAEPLGPRTPLELLVISPCTGNTLAKMACGITDTPVCMAAKAHLRTDRPLVIALASNDAMSANLKNISAMLLRKSVYFVPLCQDDPTGKPHSLVADFTRLQETLDDARRGVQPRKLIF